MSSVQMRQWNGEQWVDVGEVTREQLEELRPAIAQYEHEQKTLREMVDDGLFANLKVTLNRPIKVTDLPGPSS